MGLGARNTLSAAQTRAARGLLDWSVRRLADASRIEPEALLLFERGEADLGDQDALKLAAAVKRAGIIPINAASAGEGVRFRRASRLKSRSSCTVSVESEPLPAWMPIGDGSRMGES